MVASRPARQVLRCCALLACAASLACSSGPQVAASFRIESAATTTAADAPLSFTLTALDAEGLPVPAYTGALVFASTDDTAEVPQAAAFLASDQGKKTVQVTFKTMGTWTLSARDQAVPTLRGKSAVVTVTAAPAGSLEFENLQASADPGAQVAFSIAVLTASGAPATSYRGSLAFTSTDATAQAALPVYAFTAADAGRHSFTTSFGAAGSHTLTATDTVKPALKAVGGPVMVHGLAYTDPVAGAGKVRLVRNAGSSGGVLLLDVVMNASVNGYSVGMNLPFDLAKVSLGGTPMAPGTALDPGLAPQAFKAVARSTGPLANLLVSGLSQKAAGAGAQAADKALNAGDVLYTLRIEQKAGAPATVIFDGANMDSRFRAALRNKAGDDVVAQADFAIGKLEVL